MTDRAMRLRDARARTAERIADLSTAFEEIVQSSEVANLDDEHDPEGATVGFERAQISALLAHAQAQLVEIDDAIQRLGNGTYGACEVCAEPIPDARLEAQPAARRCVRCAGT